MLSFRIIILLKRATRAHVYPTTDLSEEQSLQFNCNLYPTRAYTNGPRGEVPMETVVKMRKYRTLEPKNAEFFTTDASKNVKFTLDDLSKSGLDPEDMDIYPTSVINLADGAVAGYQIPYYDLKGQILKDKDNFPTMWRAKFDYPTGVKGPKYLGPSTEALAKCQLLPSIPYIPPQIHRMESNELIITEGEKKTAAIVKILSLPAIGIGGCQGWRNPDGSGKVHPWTIELLKTRGIQKVKIVPDGDILRYDICAAYGTFARALERAGFQVDIIHSTGKIDDLLVLWGKDALENFQTLKHLDADNLVQSPKSLIAAHNLAFKTDAKGTPTVYQHTANIMRLMEEHPAFPKVWLNEDNNVIMLGDEPSVPNKTDMDVANYFQYNLGFEKVTDRVVHNCVLSLARTNKKSPFLEYIKEVDWDGTLRLDNWLTEYWGVDQNAYTSEVGSKWLVSACARMDKPGTKIDWMMITVGKQSTGKTSMPKIFFGENYHPLYGEQNDKDLHMLLHSHLCIGFDELDSFGKREASNLKAMITRGTDAFRPPYGMSVETFPRRFTLYGCGNKYEFLQYDGSGYRRYAVVEITRSLDFGRLESDRSQIWAEAWYRYQAGGVKYWEVSGASEQAERYTVPDALGEKVTGWIEGEKSKKQSSMISNGILYFTIGQLLSGIDELDHKSKEIAGIIRSIPGIEFPRYAITGPLGGPIKKRYYKVPLE